MTYKTPTATGAGNARFSATAIFLHWLMAAGLAANFVLGLSMADMALSPQKLQFVSWHKWAGITLLGLVSLRLLWRLAHRPPALLPAPQWQMRAAYASHFLLYVLMFAIPLSGWIMSSAGGFTVVYLGVLPLPDLVGKDRALFHTLKEVHETLNWIMLGIVVLHAAAALKHHWVERDATLARMLPWLARRSS
jgi:Cytochrome B561